MPELWMNLRAGGYLIARTLQSRLAYVAGFFIDVLSFFCVFGMTLLLWNAVAKQGATLAMPWPQLVSYLTLAFLVQFSLEMNLWPLQNGIRSGMIAIDMLRPMPLMWYYFCRLFSWLILQAFYASLAVLTLLPFLPAWPLPQDPLRWAAFALSLLLALAVQFSIVFFFVQGSFITQFGYGILYTRWMLHQVFGGGFAPLELFPEGLRQVALWLPFRHVVYTPVSLALGTAPWPEVPGLLLQQAAWALGLGFIARQLFHFLLGRSQIQGG